jgi:hypothetical protein
VLIEECRRAAAGLLVHIEDFREQPYLGYSFWPTSFGRVIAVFAYEHYSLDGESTAGKPKRLLVVG